MNRTDNPESVKKETEFWNFVNVCSVFLAFISLYTTAEGMNRFFFRNDRMHGYLISLAIQGILLSLNLRLPKYLAGKSLAARASAIGLYLFTVLWSSGFSYIFMANVIYEDTWMKDAQIEMSALYREEKQELSWQTEEAMKEAVDLVLEEVTALRNMAAGMDKTVSSGLAVDYRDYQRLFAEDAQMLQVIAVLQAGDNTSGDLSSLLSVLSSRQTALQAELDNAAEKREVTDNKLEALDEQRTELIDRRARVSAGSDAHNSYTDSIDEKTAEIEALRDKQSAYEEEEQSVSDKLHAIEALSSMGRMADSSSSGLAEKEFAGILSELGSANPDMDQISRMADRIYTTLMGKTKAGEASAEYGQLVENYFSLRTRLNEAAQIRNIMLWLEQEDTVVSDTESLVRAGEGDQELKQWRDGWNQALTALKERIILIPSSANKTEGREGWKEDTLDSLTRMQRNYLLELNAVEKAGNYLFGNYPVMAWFSLIFAFYLDTAPMLLAVFKYRCAQRKKITEKGGLKNAGLTPA